MSKCKHAEEMLEYARDAQVTDRPWELWEVDVDEDEYGDYRWSSLSTHPTWHPNRKYRRKPRTTNINGHEVSEPVRRPLASECKYFAPTVDGFYLAAEYYWQDDETDNRLLKRGLVHLTEEAATTHAKALLSCTAKELENE